MSAEGTKAERGQRSETSTNSDPPLMAIPVVRKIGALRIRIHALTGDLYAMGPGKADLLAAIEETGSISAAGRKIGMSYQKTRKLVDEMNACFHSPVVEGFKGGTQNGGARLTSLGEKALERYRLMQDHAEKAISADLDAFQDLLTK